MLCSRAVVLPLHAVVGLRWNEVGILEKVARVNELLEAASGRCIERYLHICWHTCSV